MHMRKLNLFLITLMLCSCDTKHNVIKYRNVIWSYENESVSFAFSFDYNFSDDVENGANGRLIYDSRVYLLDVTAAYSGLRILVYDNEIVKLNHYLSDESLLFAGDSIVKNDICYISITEDNIFNGTITEMQLTYTSIEK